MLLPQQSLLVEYNGHFRRPPGVQMPYGGRFGESATKTFKKKIKRPGKTEKKRSKTAQLHSGINLESRVQIGTGVVSGDVPVVNVRPMPFNIIAYVWILSYSITRYNGGTVLPKRNAKTVPQRYLSRGSRFS